jgi:hypothetical protein
MKTILDEFTNTIEFGTVQHYKKVSIVPITMRSAPKLGYVTLDQALDQQSINVQEQDDGGSVPELKLVNSSDQNVLLIDGEELEGAKQNRVLNTTIIAAAHASLTIPVSCTEQGRWSSTSRRFRSSGWVMPRDIRAAKKDSIDRSLRSNRSFRSDQGEVWSDIDSLLRKSKSTSSTRAMKSAIDSRQKELDDYKNAFFASPHQCGILVSVNGQLSGLEICSRPDAFKGLLPKLIASYAFDSLLDEAYPSTNEVGIDEGQAIASALRACEIETFDSVGLGSDIRFRCKGLSGAALVHNHEVVHMTAYVTA